MSENYAFALLQEQHEAMADVMMLRRPSSSPEQRAMADSAIAVWRKVEVFLASRKAGR
jgi:chemotaxis protein CheY-P-specific phosphatase CheC